MKVNIRPKYLPAKDFPDLIALIEISLTQLSSLIKRGYRIKTITAIPRKVKVIGL